MFRKLFIGLAAKREVHVKRLVLIFLFALPCLPANATENARPVFVKALCNGKLSSAVLSSLREVIRSSNKYRIIATLDDSGRMDEVLEVEMSCTERDNVVAIATIYGMAKCFGAENCHASMDGSSLSVALCDSNATAACGQALFKAFDAYTSHPNPAQLKLQ
jgi:hypothetical protein